MWPNSQETSARNWENQSLKKIYQQKYMINVLWCKWSMFFFVHSLSKLVFRGWTFASLFSYLITKCSQLYLKFLNLSWFNLQSIWKSLFSHKHKFLDKVSCMLYVSTVVSNLQLSWIISSSGSLSLSMNISKHQYDSGSTWLASKFLRSSSIM